MDIGEIDQGGHQVRIDLERASVGARRLLEILRSAVVENGGRGEVLRRRRFFDDGRRIHEGGHRRRLAALQLQHLRVLRVETEIQSQLSVPRREQIPQHRAERRPTGNRFVGLTNDRYSRERKEPLAVLAM
jgi:hypothetical protein